MIGGVVEVAEDGRHLSLYRGFLKVCDEERELGRVPLDDVTALVLSARQVSLSKNLITALMERNAIIVTTGNNWHPISLTLPLEGHHGQAGILQAQIALSEPRRKRLWQHIVRAKIGNQRTVLEWSRGEDRKIQELAVLEKRVRSGDPDNMEAQAARNYWPALMGADFRRDTDGSGINALLNYGYAILRAATARAVVSAGLNPALGLHHKSKVNSFALTDDLMEPYRPLVDHTVRQLVTQTGTAPEVTPDIKKTLVAILQKDLASDRGVSPLINSLHRSAQSLALCLRDKNENLCLSDLSMSGPLFQ